jgi:hypothetical protein
MAISIPNNYKLIVHVFQFSWKPRTLEWVPPNMRTAQITAFLREDIQNWISYPNLSVAIEPTTIFTDCELHILRLLRHVREEVDGIKLKPENLSVWFDHPDSLEMFNLRVDNDGDFMDHVPGGFFTLRGPELF